MSCTLAPNNNPSEVYHEILKHFNADMASKVVDTIHSDKFKTWFKDWSNMAGQIIYENMDSFGSFVTRLNFGLDNITSKETNEPKIFYTRGLPIHLNTAQEDEEDEEMKYAFEITEKPEVGSIPIFIRNNNMVNNGTIEDMVKYNIGMIKEASGRMLLYDTSDAIDAENGTFIEFHNKVANNSFDARVVKTIANSADNVSYYDSSLKDKSYKFHNGSLSTNYTNLELEDLVISSLIPSIVETIFKEQASRFKNLYAELVTSKPEHTRIVNKVNQIHYDTTAEDKQKEVLTQVLQKYLTAPTADSFVNYRLNDIYRDITSTLLEGLSSFNISINNNATFSDVLTQIESQVLEQTDTINEPTKSSEDVTELVNLKYQTATAKGMAPIKTSSMVEVIEEYMNAIKFDDSLYSNEDGLILNPHTGLPTKKHLYTDNETGLQVPISVTALKSQLFPVLKFDDEQLLFGRMKATDIGAGVNTRPNTSRFLIEVFDENGALDEAATNDKERALFNAILAGDMSVYLDKYPLKGEVEKLEKMYPRRTETIGKPTKGIRGTKLKTKHSQPQGHAAEDLKTYMERLKNRHLYHLSVPFVEITDTLKTWGIRTFIGSKFHRMAEAVMRDKNDRNSENRDKDLSILNYLDSLDGKIEEMNSGLNKLEAEYKDVFPKYSGKKDKIQAKIDYLRAQGTKIKERDAALNEENKKEGEVEEVMPATDAKARHPFILKLDELETAYKLLKNQAQIYKDLKTIKAHIKSKGGIIKVEVNVHSRKVESLEGGKMVVAGQTDILALYPDKEGVDPEYRGKFEIYDYKTDKRRVRKNSNMWIKEDYNGNPIYKGYLARKQMEHAFQLLMYGRMIEAETGLKMKDAYVIHIHVPSINRRLHTMTGDFKIDFTEYGNTDGDKATMPEKVRGLLINIKTFKGATLYPGGKKTIYKGYAALAKTVNELLPLEKYSKATAKKKANEAANIYKKNEAKRVDTALQEVVEDIKKYLQHELDKLSAVRETAQTTEQVKRIKKLRNELDSVKDMAVLLQFVVNATDEILGYESADGEVVIKSLVSVVEDIMTYHYVDSLDPARLKETLRVMDSVRLHIDNYKGFLTRIQKVFDQAPENESKALQANKTYKRMVKALKAISNLEDNYYDEAKKLMDKWLFKHASKSAQRANEVFYKAIKQRRLDDIKRIEDLLTTLPEGVKKMGYTFKLKVLKKEIEKIEEQKESMDIKPGYFDKNNIWVPGTIEKHLTQLPEDIGLIQRWLLAPISSSDKIMALYAKALKYEITTAELELQRKGVEIQNFVDSFLKNIGQGYIAFNSTKFFDKIREDRYIFISVKDEEGNTDYELKKVHAFVSEYGTQMYKVGEEEYPLSSNEIITDFIYRLKELRKKGKYKEHRALKEEFDKWNREYMENEYTPEYYEMEKVWDEHKWGKAAKEELDKIQVKIDDIRDSVEDVLDLDDEQVEDLMKLNIEKRQLGSIFKDNKLKVSEKDLGIAEVIQKYNEMRTERHNFNVNYDIFEYRKKIVLARISEHYRSRGIYIPAMETPEYYEWLSKHEEVILTDKFYNEYGRLILKKDLYFYAALTGDHDLTSYLNDTDTDRLNALDFVTSTWKWLEAKGITKESIDNKIKLHSKPEVLRKEINVLLKPYKTGNEIVNYELVPDKVVARVKQIEEEIRTYFLGKKGVRSEMSEEERQTLETAYQIKKVYQADIDDFVEHVETNTYWKKFYEEKEKAEKKATDAGKKLDGFEYKKTAWFLKNHVYGYDTKIWKPISMWTKMQYIPSGTNKVKTANYKAEKQKVLNDLKAASPDQSSDYYETKLKKSQWYKKHHDGNGFVKETSRFFEEPSTDDQFTRKQPTAQYIRSSVKDGTGSEGEVSFVRADDPERPNIDTRTGETIKDKQGYMLPKRKKWRNPKYEEMRKDANWSKFYDFFTNLYLESQDKLGRRHQMGLVFPFVAKSGKELIVEKGTALEKIKAVGKMTKEKFFMTSAFDVEDEGAKASYSNSMDHRQIPMPFTRNFYAEQDLITTNVIHGVMQFMKAAHKHEAINNIMAETRTLVALVNRREGQAGKGTVKRDSTGDKHFDAMAKKINSDSDELAKQEGRGHAAELLEDFIMMQAYGHLNVTHEWAVFGAKIRVDKIMDGLMGYAAITQIGGLNITGMLKGIANSLQAELQVAIERAAGKYFDRKSWLEARKYTDTIDVIGDAIKDYGKIASTTLSGQLKDVYDVMQGDFFDKYGQVVAGNRFQRLFSSSTWFFNQYSGEYHVAMNGLYALLHHHKLVDKGTTNKQGEAVWEVMDRDEYLEWRESQALEKGEKFGFKETLLAEQQFRGSDHSLREAYELDEAGFIRIGKVADKQVNWQIGSDRDINMRNRIHAINKYLHGVYNNFDRPTAQRGWFGRVLMMYKKYLFPALRRRFGQLRRDEELGDLRYGYYRNFFKLMLLETRTLAKEVYFNMLLPTVTRGRMGGDVDTKLAPLEKENARRAVMDLTVLAFLLGAIMLLAPDDDDDKKEISMWKYALLYELTRFSKEIAALTPHPMWMVEDNWKLLRSPSALSGFIDRSLRFVKQLGHPSEVYSRAYGIAEKGDNKAWIKFRKLFGTLALPGIGEPTNPRESWENLNRAF